jgi:peptidoglycan/LPS O-acetylase OafA/YrhL
MFFVLSGFLLASVLLKERSSPKYFSTFYTRRFCRTLPLYYLILVSFAILAGASPVVARSQQLPLLPYFLMLQNFSMGLAVVWGGVLSVTWSLAVEEHFYLLLPVVIRNLSTRTLLKVTVAVWIFADICAVAVSHYVNPIAGYTFTFCRLNAPAAGVLAAILVHKRVVIRVRWLGAALVSGALLMLLAMRWSYPGVISNYARTFAAPTYMVLLLLCLQHGFVSNVLSFRALRYLGTISYAIYLFHKIVGKLVFGYLGQTGFTVMIALVLTTFAAAISWECFESRIVRWSKSFRY